ncbi:MAG TPA: OsmC family protein [Nitriliruptorales bacterium]|nr:OsmC family protein [Nitriliruptorales bacterium]
MTGTLGGALEARGIPAGEGRLTAEAAGEIERGEDGVLVVRRIHVAYRLEVDADTDRAAVERVYGLHQERCPVARSIHPQIEVSTSLELVEV